MKDTQRKFDLDDISIIPAIISSIDSRHECQLTSEFQDGIKTLPIMASPMDTVVCSDNLSRYINNGIIPCMPRGLFTQGFNPYSRLFYFQSFGLAEIESQLESSQKSIHDFYTYPNVLIDIANGHMERLVRVVREIKTHYPTVTLMAGNVAHPLTYKNLAIAGVDYIRCSIGTGAGCTTAANVAINYPMGSLIQECFEIKKGSNLSAKIVADGGIRCYADIIKALGLGADYVMLGSIFNQSMESAGFNYLQSPLGRVRISNYDLARKLWKWGFPIYKKYRGMSTKSVQRSWGKTQLVTAEGITKYQKVEYTLQQWVSNFKDYLSSNMSYSGAKTLDEFIGDADWIFITENAKNRFQK
jgi:GMP reductase